MSQATRPKRVNGLDRDGRLLPLPTLKPYQSIRACRTLHFFASSDKAKRELGWVPKHTFMDDVAALVADYQKQGRQVGGGKMEKGRWGGRVGGG